MPRKRPTHYDLAVEHLARHTLEIAETMLAREDGSAEDPPRLSGYADDIIGSEFTGSLAADVRNRVGDLLAARSA